MGYRNYNGPKVAHSVSHQSIGGVSSGASNRIVRRQAKA